MNVVGVAGGIVLFQRQLQPQAGATELLKSTPEKLLALEVLPYHVSSMNCSAQLSYYAIVLRILRHYANQPGGGAVPETGLESR